MENNEEKIELLDEKPTKKEKKKHQDKEELNKLQQEKMALNDKLLRVTAEMQNMKRRYEEEISRIYRYEGESLIKKLLVVLDNFERAVSMDDDNLEDEVSKFLSGFKLIYNDLKKNLEDIGVKEIDADGKTFDPNMMEAVMTETVEDKENGVVTAVLQKGYQYNDKIIRPAMVKVNERISE